MSSPDPQATLRAAQQAQAASDASLERRQGDRRNGPKLRCPECRSLRSDVLADKSAGFTEEGGEAIYRRHRQCKACGALFSSVERVERVIRKGKAA